MDITDNAPPPEAIGRYQHYELMRRPDGTAWELGRGTMGVTYKAFDVNLRCAVALKVVNPALLHHPNARERFIREARAAACLRHRNIASVYHLGTEGERFFYAMEFIDGETLEALVRRQGPLSADAALRVLLQVARALAAADRQGVIHRDIKPGNLMVVHEDADDHRVVKLIDFGLARAIQPNGEDVAHLTASGFIGTPIYTSPEQLDERPVDVRSDIYSLGVTAWFLLCGKPPFTGTVASIFQQHLAKPPPFEALPPTVPLPVRKLLAHMLQKDPNLRPADAAALREEIDACRETLRQTSPEGSDIPEPVTAQSPAVVPSIEPAPPEPGPGTILKGRYELIQLMEEGHSGREYEGRDRADRNSPCSIKIFRPEVTEKPADREALAEEVHLIQSAPHANLTRLFAFERLHSLGVDFLVEEWLQGCTLPDVLAIRGGALPLREALPILAQAAAAVDHAVEKDLERIDISLHGLALHFPDLSAGVGATADPEQAIRQILTSHITAWPEWTLKVNPLLPVHQPLESHTWAGEVTLLPGSAPGHDRALPLEESGPERLNAYLHALAKSTYEMLGGSPAKDGKWASLRELNEHANAVLQRALADGGVPFVSASEFSDALGAAAGLKSEAAATATPVVAPKTTPLPVPRPDAPRVGARQVSGAVSRVLIASKPDPSASPRYAGRGKRKSRVEPGAQSSAWDRMEMVAKPRYGFWVPTILVALLLLLSFFAVLAVAFYQPARHKKVPFAKATPPVAVASPSPTATPEPAIAAATPAPVGAPATIDGNAMSGVISGSVDTPPPLVAATPPPIVPTPALADARIKIRIETQPSGAEIRTAGKLLGTTPLQTSLSPGEHQLVARYRNWPEVHDTVRVEAGQANASEEIHLIAPWQVPGEAPSGSRHATPAVAAHHDGRPSPNPAGIVHFPTPVSAGTPSTARNDPFLPQATPAKHVPVLTPFDPDGSLQPRASPRQPGDDDGN